MDINPIDPKIDTRIDNNEQIGFIALFLHQVIPKCKTLEIGTEFLNATPAIC